MNGYHPSMCSDEQHTEHMALLKNIQKSLTPKRVDPWTAMISDTQGAILDYRGCRHLFVWSSTILTILLNDLGQISIPQFSWVNLPFREGQKLFTSGQSTPVQLWFRATDEVIP